MISRVPSPSQSGDVIGLATAGRPEHAGSLLPWQDGVVTDGA